MPMLTGMTEEPTTRDRLVTAATRLFRQRGYDGTGVAEILAAAGVPVEVRVWPGQMHVFQLAAPAVSEATRSLRQIGDYIREATW